MPSFTKWVDLKPEDQILNALDDAGRRPSVHATGVEKNRWNNTFADLCARALANSLRPKFRNYDVYPTEEGEKVEYLTKPTGAGRRGKRVDVAVTTRAAGLHLALSLKGGHFPDPTQGHYGKNLTGRSYELENETRTLHEYHPHAQVIWVYFFPLDATEDSPSLSTFAKSVARLREATGRDDPLLPTQFPRADQSCVALYVPEQRPQGPQRGVCRFFLSSTAPPRAGRPKVETTLPLSGLADHLARLFSVSPHIEYADPEEPPPASS